MFVHIDERMWLTRHIQGEMEPVVLFGDRKKQKKT